MFRKNSGIENFQAKEGEASRFCRKFFYLTGPKKLRQGTILCFRPFLVGKNILWIRGEVSRSSVEKFLSHSAEKFRGHSFKVSENLGYRKILCIIGGITIFRRKIFVSQCRKTS